MTTFTNMTVF